MNNGTEVIYLFFFQIWAEILMITLIFHTTYYLLIHNFERFVKLLQMVYQLIKKKIQKTKLSKIVQLWGFVFGPLNVFGSTIKEMMSSGSSIKNSFAKELNIKDLEDIDSKLFLDTGLDIIGKNFEKEIASITGSGITLTNNYKSN